MTEAPERELAAFEALRGLGTRAVEAGRLEEAVGHFEQALALARDGGETTLIDVSLCNRAAPLIELGRGEAELPRLREILMRSADLVGARMAAYNIARHYELTKNYKKALFYARVAHGRSELLGRRDWLASSHNQIGNTLLAESQVEPACAEYERALALMPEEPSPARVRILDNLGYCRTLQRRFREAFALLYESLGMVRRVVAEGYEVSTRVDLCFAYLEVGRYSYARRHGERALALAEKQGDWDAVKNALYLLGEAANLSGDVDSARGHFVRLQREFFPAVAYLPDFLLAVDVRKLINLHA
jgi:tetratricopeptide (TPR) repeat protein